MLASLVCWMWKFWNSPFPHSHSILHIVPIPTILSPSKSLFLGVFLCASMSPTLCTVQYSDHVHWVEVNCFPYRKKKGHTGQEHSKQTTICELSHLLRETLIKYYLPCISSVDGSSDSPTSWDSPLGQLKSYLVGLWLLISSWTFISLSPWINSIFHVWSTLEFTKTSYMTFHIQSAQLHGR